MSKDQFDNETFVKCPDCEKRLHATHLPRSIILQCTGCGYTEERRQ
jgi:DNA-directed RNA polymerase subunit M/transcription elongation factor TFIIS